MQVKIDTGSRLHFGLLCPSPNQRWFYGGIGLMIDEPGCHLSLSVLNRGEDDQLEVETELKPRIERLLNDFRSGSDSVLPALSVKTHQDIPLHSGLGTGTQLTLAVAAGCRVLSGQGISRDITGIARQFGRSRRSAIGTMGFASGGFLVDYGRTEDRVERIEFPNSWRFVLIRPRQFSGLSGDSEETFFGDRKPLHQDMLTKLVQQIEVNIVPAIESQDFSQFADGLQIYGDLAGADFADKQGGLFSSPVVRTVLEDLKPLTAFTAVQSSWGPTVCLPAESEAKAQQLVSHLRSVVDENSADLLITAARNQGASIRTDGDIVQRALG